ncbi:MAG TPA: MFS transporter [Acidimicrobiales bacterium]|nr:MFS transporter [Acidimicrobiales bacterium]
MGALWQHRDFRRLFVGQGLSSLGDWTGTVALLALALRLSGSPAAASGIFVLRLAPGLVAAPIATRVALRWDRRRTMLAMDAARAVMVAIVPLVGSLAWVYLWAFLTEAASIIFLPARDASVPDLVDKKQLGSANSLLLFSSYGAIPLGAALFAGINAAAGGGMLGGHFVAPFLVDAASFAASFAFVWRIKAIGAAPAPAAGSAAGSAPAHLAVPPATDRDPYPGPVAPTARGSFTAALRIPLVRWLLPAAVTAAAGIGSLFTLGLPFIRQLAGGTTAGFGLLIAVFGLGACAGAVLVPRVAADGLAAVRVGVAVQGVLFVLVALAPSLPMAFVAAAFFGLSAAVTLAVGMACLQTSLGPDERRLALTVFHVVIRLGLSAAALAAGAIATGLGPREWPVVGTMTAVRQVLFGSGVLALAGAVLVRTPPRALTGAERTTTR